MEVAKKTTTSSNPNNSYFMFCSMMKCFSFSSSSPSLAKKSDEDCHVDDVLSKTKHGDGRNETFERLATFGLLANFMVYLLKQFHLEQVFATNIINIWSGTTNFAPLFGAFISDAYLGKFRTLAYASLASLMGMILLTLTAVMSELHPPTCTKHQEHDNQCIGPSTSQLGFLFVSLGFLTIGDGGIRPCSLPFGVDQFDQTTEDGRKGINSFFNWYYITFTVIIMIVLTLVVYIQDIISWSVGLGIPTLLMVFSILMFFVGTRVYVYVPPSGSVFSGIAQVFVSAYKKRRLQLPYDDIQVLNEILYNPESEGIANTKLHLTNQYRILNKAAMKNVGEINEEGSVSNPWTLCSIQQVEEVKCLIRIIPIWAAGIICFTSMSQQRTFTVSQALKMDRHLGPPASSLGVISMLTIGLWVAFYDRLFVPALRKMTKQGDGLTLLQRMGFGMVFSILSMVAAGVVEKERKLRAIITISEPLSVLWLAPQLILMGLAEAFNFPEHMRSIGNSFFFCTLAGADYFSSLMVIIIHNSTGKQGQPDWLYNDINFGKLDYFYYLIAGLGVLNLIYFLVVAPGYRYKATVPLQAEDTNIVIELNSIKHVDP
ncbi:hypothetical protein MKW98_021165 [Papaver atlanticum]|uniref:Uncharacterized protein n=1 Tax=Papaver atlanticum TaxID=357466 RepID=A0AAD4TA43_9MAGN|nr:hypothetical protein MKW98_021165 [Papaver atlanticum]